MPAIHSQGIILLGWRNKKAPHEKLCRITQNISTGEQVGSEINEDMYMIQMNR